MNQEEEKLYLVFTELGFNFLDYKNEPKNMARFQSVVYLLSRANKILSYEFEIYKIGPYSQHAHKEALAIEIFLQNQTYQGIELKEWLNKIRVEEDFKKTSLAYEKDLQEPGFLKALVLVDFLLSEDSAYQDEDLQEIIDLTTVYEFELDLIRRVRNFINEY